MQKLRVSVIISSYNYEKYIGETIQSVLDQTYPPYEVIVVDDESRDNSVEVIKSFGDKVILIEQKNKGACAARNHGAKMAKGEILTFVDSDDIWLPNKLNSQVEAFERDTEVGLVSCGFRAFDNSGNTIYLSNKGKSGWVAKDILLFKEPILNTTASAIAVRKDIFEKAGKFDEQREIFSAEDRDFCYRAAQISKLTFIPEVLVDYRVHGNNGHLNFKRMEKAFHISYKKIFSHADAETLKLKRQAYGNLALIFAGDHFQTGNYTAFIKSTMTALWLTPSSIFRFFGFPIRFLKRKLNFIV